MRCGDGNKVMAGSGYVGLGGLGSAHTLRLNPPAARRPCPAHRARAEGPKRDIPWLKAKKGRLPVLDTREYGGTS